MSDLSVKMATLDTEESEDEDDDMRFSWAKQSRPGSPKRVPIKQVRDPTSYPPLGPRTGNFTLNDEIMENKEIEILTDNMTFSQKRENNMTRKIDKLTNEFKNAMKKQILSEVNEKYKRDHTKYSTEISLQTDGMSETKTCQYGSLDFHVKEMSMKDARKAIKDYQWPSLSGFSSIDTYVSAIHSLMKMARKEGIPRQIISLFISQHFYSKPETAEIFARAQREEKTNSLEDILDVLQTLDPMAEMLSNEERFQRVVSKSDEPAMTYLRRLEGQFDETFKNDLRGRTRRIRKQFLEGFTRQGISFDHRDIDNLSLISDLTDLAMRAESMMNEKTSPNYRQTDRRPSYNSLTRQDKSRVPQRHFQSTNTDNYYNQQFQVTSRDQPSNAEPSRQINAISDRQAEIGMHHSHSSNHNDSHNEPNDRRPSLVDQA